MPEGVTVNALRSCAFASRQATVRNAVDLQTLMSAHVSIRAGLFIPPLLFGARFTESDSFTRTADTSGSETTVTVASVATCEAYEMALEDNAPVPYSAEFLAGLATLPKVPIGREALAKYAAFVQAFGTHVPSRLTMGGVASLWSDFDEIDYNRLVTENVDLSEGARASFLFFFGASESQGGRFSFSEHVAFRESVSTPAFSCVPLLTLYSSFYLVRFA